MAPYLLSPWFNPNQIVRNVCAFWPLPSLPPPPPLPSPPSPLPPVSVYVLPIRNATLCHNLSLPKKSNHQSESYVLLFERLRRCRRPPNSIFLSCHVFRRQRIVLKSIFLDDEANRNGENILLVCCTCILCRYSFKKTNRTLLHLKHTEALVRWDILFTCFLLVELIEVIIACSLQSTVFLFPSTFFLFSFIWIFTFAFGLT